jgi:signal peptidase I
VLHDTGPTGYIIKRVKWLGGQRVDWKWVPEDHEFTSGDYIVPEGQVYVLGDNKDHSEDSRKFGPVPMKEIIGKVVVWP